MFNKIVNWKSFAAGFTGGASVITYIQFIKELHKKKILIMTKIRKKKIKKLKITKRVMNHLMKIKNKVNSLKHVFIFPWIISNLDIQISDSDSSFMHFAYSVFFLSLVSFFCLVNIVGYSITYYLIQKGNYENKYPRISKFINRYKKGTILLYIIEVVLCFICLSILIIFSFLILYSNIKS